MAHHAILAALVGLLIAQNALARATQTTQLNDFHLGLRQASSQLVRTEHFRSNQSLAVYVAYVAQRIDYLVARDQSGGGIGGAYVRYYNGGIRQWFVELHFAQGTAESIDFVVEIWGAPTIGFPVALAADLVQGERRAGAIFSVLDVVMSGLPGQQLNSGTYWISHSARYITHIRTFDLTGNGSGGVLTLKTAVNETAVEMHVDSVRPGSGCNFRIYVETLPLDEDEPDGSTFVLGEWNAEMELLEERYVLAVNKWQDQSITRTVEIFSPTIIGAIVGLDFSEEPRGSVTLLSGGIGHKHIVLLFESGVGDSLKNIMHIFGAR